MRGCVEPQTLMTALLFQGAISLTLASKGTLETSIARLHFDNRGGEPHSVRCDLQAIRQQFVSEKILQVQWVRDPWAAAMRCRPDDATAVDSLMQRGRLGQR